MKANNGFPSLACKLASLAALILYSCSAANAEPTGVGAANNNSVSEAVRHAAQAKRVEMAKGLNTKPSKLGQKLSTFINKRSGQGSSEDSAERVQVYIKVEDSNNSEMAVLSSLGVDIELINTQLNMVQAWLEPNAIEQIKRLRNVIGITLPKYGEPQQGSVLTQGDNILKANQLRQLGFRGQGVRVGIVSDGANAWTTARASGNLPAQLTRFGTCTPRAANQTICRSAKTCNEGTAMAEIVHDLAPDAELAVAGANTSLEFIQRIGQLANNFGADIIVDDLGFFGEPYFADGDIAKAVQALPKHILYVSSAGNSGHTHYSAQFVDANVAGGSFHDFASNPVANTDTAHGFAIAGQRGAFVLMQWNDPFTNAQSDYDLYISSQTQLVASSATGGSTPFEGTCVYNSSPNPQVFFAQVDKFSGADKELKMYFLGAGSIEYPMRSDSIFGHAATPRAIAVGSINASEPGNDNIAFYSSGGPSKIEFPSPSTRNKPDLVAIDGVDVSGAGGFSSPFFGTSAAAPHVAGVGALLMSAHKKATAREIRVALTRSAKDLGSPGFDAVYGHGIVDALAAFETLPLTNPAPFIMLLMEEDNP